MFKVEREKGVYDAETKLPQGIDVYGPAILIRRMRLSLGYKPMLRLKRGIFPKGGIRMVENSLGSLRLSFKKHTKLAVNGNFRG